MLEKLCHLFHLYDELKDTESIFAKKVGGKSIDNRTLSYVANRMKAFSGGRGVLGNIENVNNTVVEITVRVIY